MITFQVCTRPLLFNGAVELFCKMQIEEFIIRVDDALFCFFVISNRMITKAKKKSILYALYPLLLFIYFFFIQFLFFIIFFFFKILGI